MEGAITAHEAEAIVLRVSGLKTAAANRIGARLAASWARGTKRAYARLGARQDELPEDERRQFAQWLTSVPGATDEDGAVNPELLETLLAAGRILHREFVWPEEAREQMLQRDREAGAGSQS